ncbi:hypothetical protein HOLleu_41367 [Holothuria leucospilota]|uniref:Endonuclease/exonuclease/phosphatase domain-containing protein n=1 Tax=Holothuria leucospilota TaxID=206669 RepID=A0A9Q0YBH2_HOLLE|nr:hypothetical protein HOLleu_41367 [Holothuria leucospilota]
MFNFLHVHKFDFFMLQETHSKISDETYWKAECGGYVSFSHGEIHSRCVCVLVNPKTPIHVLDTISDPFGRYLLLVIECSNEKFFLINVYAPNRDEPSFFLEVSNYFDHHLYCNVIWGGDFNFVFNLLLDKTGGIQRTNFKARDEVLSIMQTFNLIDIWRERYLNTRAFTWHSNIDENIHCRLDFFLISRSLINNVYDCGLSSWFGSDHCSVTLCRPIIPHSNIRGRGSWKLNCSLLNDPGYRDFISDVVDQTICNYSHLDDCSLWELLKFS